MSLKERIIQNEIVNENDWDLLTDEHKKLAEIFLYFLENFENDYDYDEEEFKEKFYRIQDELDLEELDLVKSEQDKSDDLKSFSMRIPKSIIKVLDRYLEGAV
jgi:hypothetical protein